MKHELVSALIEKNAFTSDLIITAHYRSVDLFGRVFDKVGDFRVKKIVRKNDLAFFELITLGDGSSMIRAAASSIKAIDGMDPIRFADMYDILPDGSKKKVGKKRGRKPRI